MLYLLLAIFCSTCLLVIFKVIERNNLEKLPVIIMNYFTAAAIGAAASPGGISFDHFISQPWFPLAVLLGFFFVAIFYTVALSTEINGIAITAVAFKLSLVIPVTAAFFLYKDNPDLLKIAGIMLALAAITLTSKSESGNSSKSKGLLLLLPAVVFTGNGFCDAMVNYLQVTYLQESDFTDFLVILFLTAGVSGSFMLAFNIIKKKSRITLKVILAGIALGIPNYGSVYFMIHALENSGIQPSALWPLNNIGIILLSTILAALLFGERMNRFVVAGIITAMVSILLIGLSAYIG